jgi:hypothetical protein
MQDPTLAAMEQDKVDAANAIAAQLTAYSYEFDQSCEDRYRMGAEKYGPGKFLAVDTIAEALAEIVDLANYARFTFIKLRMLQEAIVEQGMEADVLGADGFVSARQATDVKGKS